MHTKKMILTALLIALTAVTTMVVSVPVPAVKGYINIGDSVVILSGLIFGPWAGAAAGAIGSSLADLLLGYTFWAPWTFVIKGLEGFLAGWLILRSRKETHLSAALAASAAAATMVLGYFVASSIIYQSVPIAVMALPGDLIQGGVSALLCLVLMPPIKKYLSL